LTSATASSAVRDIGDSGGRRREFDRANEHQRGPLACFGPSIATVTGTGSTLNAGSLLAVGYFVFAVTSPAR